MKNKTNQRSKKILRWVQFIIVIYCAIGIALYYLQERFLFHPKKLNSNYTYKFPGPFREFMIPLNSLDTISMVKFFPVGGASKGVVIYFHGNMENIEHYAAYTGTFTAKGYEVWMPDYPGFGKSNGKLTEEKLYSMALQVQKMAASRFSNDSIIIYGKSLGTGIAAYIASITDCRALILETPYYSIPSLFSCYAFIYPTGQMSNFKIPTYEFLKEVKAPVSIFHGTKDEVIPIRNAIKLVKSLKPGDVFLQIKNGNHNNLFGNSTFIHSLDSILH
ncbi:MAG TPA: alpha/beta fold hydrolase [Ferruginibacter sp.]|nr:alpha/beta fold hydrolase [Ferruginibacter sp.]